MAANKDKGRQLKIPKQKMTPPLYYLQVGARSFLVSQGSPHNSQDTGICRKPKLLGGGNGKQCFLDLRALFVFLLTVFSPALMSQRLEWLGVPKPCTVAPQQGFMLALRDFYTVACLLHSSLDSITHLAVCAGSSKSLGGAE